MKQGLLLLKFAWSQGIQIYALLLDIRRGHSLYVFKHAIKFNTLITKQQGIIICYPLFALNIAIENKACSL